MDEDATGNRTPPRARSPDAVPLSARLPPSRFATEAAAAKGGAAPVTPAAGKGLAVSFVSPLAAGAEDSLPASFDSLALQDSPEPPSSSMAATSMAASSTFGGATSYAPTSRCGPGATAGAGGRPRKTRSRRKLAIGSRLLKLTTQVSACSLCTTACCPVLGRSGVWWLAGAGARRQLCRHATPALGCNHRSLLTCSAPLTLCACLQTYPPLVESRAAGAPSMSALAVFRDLTEEQWERFMGVVQCQVQRKLRDGVWKSAAAAKAPPMMSCPRF